MTLNMPTWRSKSKNMASNTIGGKQINRNYKNDKLCRINHDSIKRL